MLLSVAILLNFSLFSQTSDREISGIVKDKSNGVPFLNVYIEGTNLGTTTNDTGYFYLAGLPIGPQLLRIQGIGYKSVEQWLPPGQQNKNIEFNIEEDVIQTEEVVVTASRQNESRKEAISLVKTVNSEMLFQTASRSLADGANFVPGLRLETNCQNCGFTQLRMNGLEGPYTQILINSRPLVNPLIGVYGLEMFPASTIAKIETTRGGGSAVYGANAIGGTVNILMKEPVRNQIDVGTEFGLINLEAPEWNIYGNGAWVSKNSKTGGMLFANYRTQAPWNANPDTYWDSNGDGVRERSDDFTEIVKMNSLVLGTNVYHRIDPYNKISGDIFIIDDYRRGGNKLDSAPHEADIAEEVGHQIITGGLQYDRFFKDKTSHMQVYLSGQWVHRHSYYGAEQDPGAYGTTLSPTWVAGGQYNGSLYISDQQLKWLAGVEYQYNGLDDRKNGYFDPSENLFKPDVSISDQEIHNPATFGQIQWNRGRWNILAGLRYDYFQIRNRAQSSGFDTYQNLSPRIHLKYDVNENTQLRAGISTGFRAPQIFNEDLHIEASGARRIVTVNSPNLEPEQSISLTAGIDWDFKLQNIDAELIVEVFYTQLHNPFAPEYEYEDSTRTLFMIRTNSEDPALVAGSNIEFKMVPSLFFNLQIGYTLQTAKYGSPQAWGDEETSVSDDIMRAPSHYGYITANWSIVKSLSLATSAVVTGPMKVPHYPGGTLPNGEVLENERLEQSPTFLDINIQLAHKTYASWGDIEIYAGIRNLLNSYQDDFDAGLYRDAGYIYGPKYRFSIYGGIKYTPSL